MVSFFLQLMPLFIKNLSPGNFAKYFFPNKNGILKRVLLCYCYIYMYIYMFPIVYFIKTNNRGNVILSEEYTWCPGTIENKNCYFLKEKVKMTTASMNIENLIFSSSNTSSTILSNEQLKQLIYHKPLFLRLLYWWINIV